AGWTGNRLAEIQWRYQEEGRLAGKHGFQGFWVKPNRQIGFDVDPRTLAIKNVTSYTPQGGYDFDIPVEKCLWYAHNLTNNNRKGVGAWRACYNHWFRLDANLKFWALALERWGAPVLIMIYPASAPSEMQAAQQAANSIRQGSPPVIPDNVKY